MSLHCLQNIKSTAELSISMRIISRNSFHVGTDTPELFLRRINRT